MTTYYQVGKIVNTHGIKGEVRVISSTDFKDERYQPGKTLYFFNNDQQRDGIPLVVSHHRTHKQFDLLMFEGHTSINDVEKYKGGLLKVSEEDRVPLENNEYYFDDIIGCHVQTESGDNVGVITSIITTGANDVWVVKNEANRKEVLIPYIEDVVKNVDIDHQKITIHVIEGLLE